MNNSELTKIKDKIYIIRNQNVMLDFELALLYGVETGALNRAVKRNLERFPSDFMFQLTEEEYLRCQTEEEYLRCQIGIANPKRRYAPYAFTETGIAMLSSVINSKEAISVNISIMRLFIKLRSFMVLEKGINERVDRLEKGTNKMFKIVFERLDDLDNDSPPLQSNRKKIGLKNK